MALAIYTFDEVVEGIFWGGLVSIFGGLLLMLGLMLLGVIDAKFEKSNSFEVTYIKSLSINSQASGHFFLGSGTIENKNYYYFVTESELGYRIDKVEITSDTYVREDCSGGSKPFIEKTKYKATHINWFVSLFFTKEFFVKDGEVIIHVPKNTVVRSYKVDVGEL